MKRRLTSLPAIALALLVTGLAAAPSHASVLEVEGTAKNRIEARPLATFQEPWAMTFLPDGRMLVTEKAGRLLLVEAGGTGMREISGLPAVDYGGQGGLGDIVLHPDFDTNRLVYISYAEAGSFGRRGAVVARGTLSPDSARLTGIKVIWRQQPKVTGRGHYSHRLVFGPDGHLFITSGDRQKLDPAQDAGSDLGKIIRLRDDGSVPDDNPFQSSGERARSYWSTGHRNLLGIAFDAEGRLWQTEMGPRHGDELNIVKRGANYGWPVVSEGSHYSGAAIPPHAERPEFEPPRVAWVPTIAPSGLVIYGGDLFPDWRGDAFIGGLASSALIRVDLDGDSAGEAERFEWDERIREVEEGPDGALYVLEDGQDARLLRITPAR